jgi:50S ribosomal protein L16 3-hydroxylase
VSPPALRLDVKAFLARSWQRKAALLRGALPGFRDPLAPRALMELAARPDVESRLVRERGGRRPWQVDHGPFRPERFRRLPRSHWTLLVQGVDRHLPEVAVLQESFGFAPAWRRDDVMVSFAAPRGGVGPHLDSYDVFLVQGLGRRRWAIDPRARPDYRPGLDLRILRRFEPAAEWVLEPGDVLYVPPGVAHRGIALEDCLTYSIGFRAPTAAELLASVLPSVAARGDGAGYRDGGRLPPPHPGEISPRAVAGLRALLSAALARVAEADFAETLGRLLTEPRDAAAPPARRVTAAEVRSRSRRGRGLVRAPGARLAYLRRGRDVLLFADGQPHRLPPALAFAGPLLADGPRVPGARLLSALERPGFAGLVAQLLSQGALRFEAAR